MLFGPDPGPGDGLEERHQSVGVDVPQGHLPGRGAGLDGQLVADQSLVDGDAVDVRVVDRTRPVAAVTATADHELHAAVGHGRDRPESLARAERPCVTVAVARDTVLPAAEHEKRRLGLR